MIRRMSRRIGPWAAPATVAAEALLVGTGRLSFEGAVVWLVVIELVLCVTVAHRMVAAHRRFRSARGDGVDVWRAAEDGLAELVPRALAHGILLEPRLWWALIRWATRRGAVAGETFRYDASLRPILYAAVALVVVEGAAVEFVVAGLTSGMTWVWVSLAIHLYAVIGLLGLLAGFATRPHTVTREAVVLRDGVFREIRVPVDAVAGVRVRRRQMFGRSGLRVDEGVVVMCHGDATLRIELNPETPLRVITRVGRPREEILTLDVTADDPAAMAHAIRTARGRPCPATDGPSEHERTGRTPMRVSCSD